MTLRIFAFSLFLLLLPAGVVRAETIVDADITSDTTWDTAGSPYIVRDMTIIGPQATLSIKPGVEVQMGPEGGFEVVGAIHALGTEKNPISFSSNGSWYGIAFDSLDATSSLSHVRVEGAYGIFDFSPAPVTLDTLTVQNGEAGIMAYGGTLSIASSSFTHITGEAFDIRKGSSVHASDITVSDVESGFQIYEGSSVTLNHLTMSDVESQALAVYLGSHAEVWDALVNTVRVGGGIAVFGNSTLTLSRSTLLDVLGGEAVSLFDQATMTIRDSTISRVDSSDAIGLYSSSTFIADGLSLTEGTGNGFEVYSGATLSLTNSRISDFTSGAGIVDYGDLYYPTNTINLTHSVITHNNAGLVSYSSNSTLTFSRDEISHNATAGLVSYSTSPIDARNIYWGDPSGPYNDPDNLGGKGNAIYASPESPVRFSPWLTALDELPPSNVLFLPGIEGSRLYIGPECGKDKEERLWEPYEDPIKALRRIGDEKVRQLYLNQFGMSPCSEIYTKPGDVIDSVNGDNIYAGLITSMNALKADGTITEWRATAYDWRLSLDEILSKGRERDGHIYYEDATATPYIEQTLRELASSSKSGKVTLITHSNGGLVAKALLQKLGDEAPRLVDKLIMVGVPQTGAPMGIGATLFGYKQAIESGYGFDVVHSSVMRALSQNAPGAYHLLPSEDYIESTIGDTDHPLVRFSGAGYLKEEQAYGATIGNRVELADFLLAREGGRVKPKVDDMNSAEILNPKLIAYATSTHASLDSWTPPTGIQVDQIAGWGVDTLAGLDFYSTPGKVDRLYRPIMVEDGDGTVTVPSAIQIASSTSVRRLWLDLNAYNRDNNPDISHKDLFEISALRNFINDRVQNVRNVLPDYFSQTQPTSASTTKKLIFFLHSPLTLQLQDSFGNVTGVSLEGTSTEGIPGSTYGELGEVKYVIVPSGDQYQLMMHGQDYGTFSLDIQESLGDVVVASSTIASVPTNSNTLATLSLTSLASTSPLTIDEDGDGRNIITLTPKIGDTIFYDPPEMQAPPPLPMPTKMGNKPSGLMPGPFQQVYE